MAGKDSFSAAHYKRSLGGSARQTRITGEFRQAGQKERRSATYKHLPYYVNVNRTSLDHLLLGRNADVDKSVE